MQTTSSPIRVGIFMGGRSLEREVSFNSGRTAYDYLDRNFFEPVPLYIHKEKLFVLPEKFLYRGKTTDFVDFLDMRCVNIPWDNLKNHIDIALILLHGRWGEDGCIQAMLIMLGIPFVGSGITPSALTTDKVLQKRWLAAHSFPVARSVYFSGDELKIMQPYELENVVKKNLIEYPVVIKPRAEGSSLGVFIAHNAAELYESCKKSSSVGAPEYLQDVLVEEKLEGLEFTTIVIADGPDATWRALEPTEIELESRKTFFDYDQKYMPGRGHKHTPARLPKADRELIQNTCVRAVKEMQMRTFTRVDGFFTLDKNVYILDVNSFPGMSPSSLFFMQAAQAGISPTEILTKIIAIEMSLQI